MTGIVTYNILALSINGYRSTTTKNGIEMAKTIVYYNGMPITLSKSYATAELKRSKLFCDKLAAKIVPGHPHGEHALNILNRRREWIAVLEQYLATF